MQTAAGRSDVPDYLLFANAVAQADGVLLEKTAARSTNGASTAEAKAWGIALGRGSATSPAPSTQMLRHLGTIEVSPPETSASDFRPAAAVGACTSREPGRAP